MADTKDDCLERSPVAKTANLYEENLDMEKPIKDISKQCVNESTQVREDEEDSEEFLECLEWNMDAYDVMDSIELECLSELEFMLKSKVKQMGTSESSLDDKLRELKQKIKSMMETIGTLKSELENERAHLMEVEKERCMLDDRIKEQESNEQKLSKMVEDLKSQVVLLNDLVYGGKKQAKKTKGCITCDGGVKFSMALERLSQNLYGFEVFGIAILENELFVVSNDNVTVVYDLSTLKFKRRWKVPRKGTYDDIKQCNVNKCLYMMKVDSETHNEIIRIDPNGNEIAAWSVDKARGQLSVTSESNVLLTVSSLNQLHEYTPDGKVDQVIDIPWNSGIEKPSHAIKLTSDHFLICHGNDEGPLIRVCIMEKAGNVLKYFGELWKRSPLVYPIYLDRDGTGNILVADQYYNCKGRVLLLSSDLKFKQYLITHESRYPNKNTDSNPKKVCFDKSNGRVFMVENVKKYNYSGENKIEDNDTVSVFKV